MTLTQRELGFIGGLFEGEGSIGMRVDNKRGLQTPSLQLMTTDEDTMRHFHRLVGFGKVHGPYKIKDKNNKPYWQWSVTSFEKVQYCIALFWNDLGRRRKDTAIEILRAAKLRPVKSSQRTHCPQGHPYDEANTWIVTRRSGSRDGLINRVCRACSLARQKAARLIRTPEQRSRLALRQKDYRSRRQAPSVISIHSAFESNQL